MNLRYLFILISFFPISLSGQIKFYDPDSDIFYHYDGSEGEPYNHFLTFQPDSLFHITVPNSSGSCWSWGEYGGRIETKGDTVIFYFPNWDKTRELNTIVEEKEVFVLKNGKTFIRVSEYRFMSKEYELAFYKKKKK